MFCYEIAQLVEILLHGRQWSILHSQHQGRWWRGDLTWHGNTFRIIGYLWGKSPGQMIPPREGQ